MKAEQLDAVQKLIAAQTNSGAVIICKTRLVRVLCSSTLVPYIAGRCTNRRSNRMTCAGGTPSQIRDSTTAHLLESRSACKVCIVLELRPLARRICAEYAVYAF